MMPGSLVSRQDTPGMQHDHRVIQINIRPSGEVAQTT